MVVQRCIVNGCVNTKTRTPNLSFHQIPAEYYMRSVWIRQLQKNGGYNPSKGVTADKKDCVCREHFENTCFTGNKLLPSAKPTIFSLTLGKNIIITVIILVTQVENEHCLLKI